MGKSYVFFVRMIAKRLYGEHMRISISDCVQGNLVSETENYFSFLNMFSVQEALELISIYLGTEYSS